MEGVIIDSDHGRHFYLLAAMVWGMMSVRSVAQLAIEALGRINLPRTPRGRPRPSAASTPHGAHRCSSRLRLIEPQRNRRR